MIHFAILKSCIPRKKPYLNAEHRKRRLLWAVEKKNWDINKWNKVIWTDEESVEIGKNSKEVRVWSYTGEEWYLFCLLPIFKSGRSSAMVWCCFAGTTMGPLAAIPRNRRNVIDYRDLILEGPLHEFYLSMKDVEGEILLMEDGATIHRSKAAGDWRTSSQINVLKWLAQSPNINPIENFWHSLKAQINKRLNMPKNETEL